MTCCRGLALALAAVSARICSAAEAKKPGDPDYHLDLADIHTTLRRAVLDPPFDPEATDMKLLIDDVHATSVTLWMKLAREFYHEGGSPNIWHDDEMIRYDPLQDIHITVPLNKTIDAVEQKLRIKVEDPKTKEGPLKDFQTKRAHEYVITVMQAPEWDLVLQAQNISVTSLSGQSIKAKEPGPFNATSDNSRYAYDIKEGLCSGEDGDDKGTCKIKVQVTCTDVATALKIDEEEVENGEMLTYDMTNSAETIIAAECLYDNKDWTKGASERRFYQIILRRDIKFKGDMSVKLFPYEGQCEKKIGQKGEQSFDCRVAVDAPRLILHASLAAQGDELSLKSPDSPNSMKVRNGIPIEVPIPESGDLQVTLVQGTETLTYPIRLHQPAMCDASLCSDNMALWADSDRASEHTCRENPCDEKDRANCCGEKASCSTFLQANSCPENHTISKFAAKLRCNGTICSKEDAATCCVERAPCFEFEEALCPEKSYVRADWLDVYCKTDECGEDEEDAQICCLPASKGTCAFFPEEFCPKGTSRRVVGSWLVYCKGEGECTEEDAKTCCAPPAKCSTYTCPENLRQKKGSEDESCKNEVCDMVDTETCCKAAARCDTMKCRGDRVLRHDAELLWCAGTKCTQADQDTCCITHGNCGDYQETCGDKQLVYLADAVLCRGDICNEKEDKKSCCTEREGCQNFPGTCPERTKLWKDGLCETKACTSSEDDTELCCQPLSSGGLDGMLTISNLNFGKLTALEKIVFVEGIVGAALTEHLKLKEDQVNVLVSSSLSGEGVYCNFNLDIDGLSETAVSDIRAQFKEKLRMTSALMINLADIDDELRGQPSEEIKINFIQLAEDMVDPTHGGIPIPARVLKQDGDDSWTLQFPGGVEDSGFETKQLRTSDGNDKITEGADVTAIVRLARVADWVELGLISEDVSDFLPLDDGDAKDETGKKKELSVLAQTLRSNAVAPWPAPGGLPAAATAGSMVCVLSLAALLYRGHWLQRLQNSNRAVPTEARELLESQA